MERIDVYDQYGVRQGHFDLSKATVIKPLKRYGTGAGDVCVHTGDSTRSQQLIRTAQGRWVLCHTSQWAGEEWRYEFVSEDAARRWLIRNEDDLVERYFGPQPEESGPGGRPAIGPAINTRVTPEQLARLDARAERWGVTRAEALRRVLDQLDDEACDCGEPA